MKELEIASASVTYVARVNTKDANGKILVTSGHMGFHEIELEHFPQALQDAIIAFVKKAERERGILND